MLQFVLIQLLNQAVLCFPAEYNGNNNPKLARILHYHYFYQEAGGINETSEWEGSCDLNRSDERGAGCL